MRRPVTCILIMAIFGIVLNSAQAISADLTQWFLSATAYDAPGTSKEIATPDFLPGKSFADKMCKFKYDKSLPGFYTFWQLLRYDRKHHIGLARASTDQTACALFKAPTPAVTVPDADLSQFCTGRGLCIGSAYAQVLSVYGPPVKRGRHFVTSYSATVPDVTVSLPHKPVKLPERITLVIDNDRVSSIVIHIDLGDLF